LFKPQPVQKDSDIDPVEIKSFLGIGANMKDKQQRRKELI
jgi:hypothetical protein